MTDIDRVWPSLIDEGEEIITQAGEYHSNNTHRLNEKELTKLLIELKEIQNDLMEFKSND